MRPRLAILCLTVLSAACRTTDGGSTVSSDAGDAGTPCNLETQLACPEDQHDGCLTATTGVHKCIDGDAYTGEQDGIDCALEIALACEDDEVDGCLTGQSTVHKCVSDGTTAKPSGIRTVKLYPEPHFFAEPSCDSFTELKLTKSKVSLTNVIAGTCELAVNPDPKSFDVTVTQDSCGTKIYKGSSGARTVQVEDNTRRTCENVVAAMITVEVKDGEKVQRLYSER